MNTIHLRGEIAVLRLHATSIFMVVKENGTNGSRIQVKAFCPPALKDTPDAWLADYQHWAVGMKVIIEGRLMFEPEKARNNEGQFVNVQNPITGRDIYQAYVWAYDMDVVVDPTQRPPVPASKQAALPSQRQQAPAMATASPPVRTPLAAPKPAADQSNHAPDEPDDLPDVPWNMP